MQKKNNTVTGSNMINDENNHVKSDSTLIASATTVNSILQTIVGVVDYSSSSSGSNPDYSFDGNLTTGWTVDSSKQWILYDLGERKRIDKFKIAFNDGDKAVYDYQIQSGVSHRSFDPWRNGPLVWNAKSSGNASGLEWQECSPTVTRYFYVLLNNRTGSAPLGIKEIEVWSEHPDILPPASTSPLVVGQGWNKIKYAYYIEWPWTLPISSRYSFSNHIHTIKVENDDPYQRPNGGSTHRTEIRGINQWNSGEHLFEADFYICKGTGKSDIFQLYISDTNPNTAIMIRTTQEGDITYYSSKTLATNMHEKWFNLKVYRDIDDDNIIVYLDDVEVFSGPSKGEKPGQIEHFKCGLYHGSGQVLIRNIHEYYR